MQQGALFLNKFSGKNLFHLLGHFFRGDINQEAEPSKINAEYCNAGFGKTASGIQQGAVTADHDGQVAAVCQGLPVDHGMRRLREDVGNALIEEDPGFLLFQVGGQGAQCH